MKNLYLNKRIFYGLAIVIISFVAGYFHPFFFDAGKILLILLGFLTILDIMLVYSRKHGIKARRLLPRLFSNGDENPVEIGLQNRFPFRIRAELIDEIPFQFQIRNFQINVSLQPGREKSLQYTLRPTTRGDYHFGRLLVYVGSPLGLVSRRFVFRAETTVKTYPSFLSLRKYDLVALANRTETGIKKIRRRGHSMEFEQIKEYVPGDDIRTINWKATAKRNRLMVNQYQEEKSRNVYSVIDKGRVMKMPFDGMTLLDYAINSSLVISNVILKKGDKAGVFAFSRKVDNRVVAERRTHQMQLILDALYRIETDFEESDFGVLYADIKRHITQRSLLFLFTNFETLDGMDRQLAYLQALARHHLTVVIFFENAPLKELAAKPANTLKDIYYQTIAQKFVHDKKRIVKELNRRGIHAILTEPQHLTVDLINKYLELKARGLI